MTQKPTSRAEPLRFVLITLDHHVAGAIERTRAALAKDIPGLELVMHVASDFEDPAAAAAARADIATADIVFANMLFLEPHIQAVLPALQARRDNCDAMVCAMSAGEVMRLTRMGSFKMDGSASGPMALLKKLRGQKPAKDGKATDGGARQMAMLKKLPKILRFIPGTAQDVRIYFLTLGYWLAGSSDNLGDLVRTLVNRYADGPRRHLRGTLSPQPPREYPEMGLYHPSLPSKMTTELSAMPTSPSPAGTVGVVIMRAYVLSGDTGHYDAAIAALEARGLRVLPIFAAGLDARPAIEKFFIDNGKVKIDALVSLTGFSLVGGPAFNDAKAGEEILARLDVPYVAAQPLELQTIEQWQNSPTGLTPVESTLMVAIPELDGATGPIVFGGRSAPGTGGRAADMAGIPDRVDLLARRVAQLIELRTTPAAKRNVAIVLFNFPPNGGATGTAAYLSVFESLFNTLKAMAAEGYDVEVPATVDELRARVLEGNAARYGTDANVVALVSVDDHVRYEPHLEEIEKQWGPAPGKLQTDGQNLLILGARFGRVLVGIQPAFGYEGDPMRLLFESGFAPTHAFSAFYRYLREGFGAHVALHFGTHGALEFMPGKQAGMSAECWPERLIGDLPNLYLYAANNPSEGAVARRRSAATLVSYLTPPVTEAGLYRGLAALRSSLDAIRGLPPGHGEIARALPLLQSQAVALELACAGAPPWHPDGPELAALSSSMSELEQTLIPCGLHVLGEGMTAEARADTIAAMVDGTPLSVLSRTAVDALVAGGSTDVVMAESGLASTPANVALLEELAQTNRHLQENQELPALMHALDAGFVRPAPGGDLLRTPTILPTGRNVHGFDPFAIPSAFAILDGAEQAARLLARHVAEGNALPESVALVLWGTDNLKSGGGPIGQALALLGARPRFDSYGRLCGAALMPLEELGRPRIDVLITVSGIFRDLLPLQTRLLAEAALLASAADEPLELNFVRRHTLAHQKSHGCDLETAALRVFSNADGAYGANVNHLIDAGTWENEDELGDAFARRKSFAYGIKGPPVRHDGLLKSVLAGVELTYQNVESVELGVTSLDQYFDALGGMTRAATRERGTAPAVYIGDQTHGAAKVRTLNEQVALETRTRSLNPRWSEEMLKHGAEGVRHIEAQITNTLGWSATTGRVDAWVYRELTTTYLLDPAMRARLAALNPKAASKLAQRLIEASDRSYWSPDADMLAAMHDAADEIEDRLEGVTRPIPSAATAAETSPSTVSTSTATRVEPRAQAFGLSLDNAHAA